MRDLTQQELDSINTYIDKISVKTGVNFLDILDGEDGKKLKEMEESDDNSQV